MNVARRHGQPTTHRHHDRAHPHLPLRVCPPQRSKLLVYLKADPKHVDLVPGFTRDVSGLGHHRTGDLEVQPRTPRDVERAQDLFRASNAAA